MPFYYACADVALLDINLVGPVIAVRPYCHTDHYWQVYFDTNAAIIRVAQEVGISLAEIAAAFHAATARENTAALMNWGRAPTTLSTFTTAGPAWPAPGARTGRRIGRSTPPAG